MLTSNEDLVREIEAYNTERLLYVYGTNTSAAVRDSACGGGEHESSERD